jgi:ATP-dependent Clp protease ATP-binding subunit ClpX
MGFGSTHKKDVKIDRSTVISEDLIKYGFMPEFVGRFTNITVLNKLKEDDLVKIMTETTNSITQQYQKLFQLSGINLSFDEKVLHDIAKVAVDKGTGARALKTLLETEMKDLMFELPGSGVKEYTVKKIKKGKFKNEGN